MISAGSNAVKLAKLKKRASDQSYHLKYSDAELPEPLIETLISGNVIARTSMELKPARGLKVKVDADKEAVFGEEAVQVKRITLPKNDALSGIMTGTVIAGYCEVDMPTLDGKRHWYPVDGLVGENGEKIVEEEIELPEESDDSEETEEDDSEE